MKERNPFYFILFFKETNTHKRGAILGEQLYPHWSKIKNQWSNIKDIPQLHFPQLH